MKKTTSHEAELEKKISEMDMDKRMLAIESRTSYLENSLVSMNATISTFGVQMGSLDRKLDQLQALTEKVNTKLYGNRDAKIDGFLEQLEAMLATFTSKRDFEEHVKDSEEILKEAMPVIRWGRERMTIEKYMIALISFVGFSSVANVVILVVEYFQRRS